MRNGLEKKADNFSISVNDGLRNRYHSRNESEFRFVQITVVFLRIGEIDTMNEKYQAEVQIEAKWIDNDQSISEYDPNKHWNPKLYIENILVENKEVKRYTVTHENENQVITEIRTIKGVFWERLELYNFPLDIQELSITVTSKLLQTDVKLISDPTRTSYVDLQASHTFIDQQKWKLYKLVKVSETASYDGSINSITSVNKKLEDFHEIIFEKNINRPPKLVATIFCSRKPGYYFFNAFFLIFLITVSSLTIFSVGCKLPQNRLQTTFTLLLTSVSFKWVINRCLPTVSYLTSLDKYAIVSIFYICLLCIWHSIVGSFWEPALAADLDRWLLVAFAVLFIFYHILFFIWVFYAYTKIWKIKTQEKDYLKAIGSQNSSSDTVRRFITRI